jgi:argininosuccinate lyase
MSKLWEKKNTDMHPAVNAYITSNNLEADNILFPYDITASMAHAKMLAHVELITQQECDDLVRTLEELRLLHQEGKFCLKQKNEDMHTAIEHFLTERLGDTGKKIHTGRSRNDQVLVAMRLCAKENIQEGKGLVQILAQTLLGFAKEHVFIPMPGYTHTQRAMPSSVGQWAGSFVESLLDDLHILQSAYVINDQNPLGSAAGFGTNLPIDREFTTRELGFARTQINPIYCQNSRGKIEGFTLTALLQVMESLGKMANDVIWFTSKEFDFFSVHLSLTTGSSIMPQKRNLDIMEVLRANVSVVESYQMQVQGGGKNLLSGYHKDLKITKKALLDAFEITKESLKIINLLFKNISPKKESLENALDPEIFATDEVNRLVLEGVPFREAYKRVGNQLHSLKEQNVSKIIASRTHLGATGNLGLDVLESRIKCL